ncbi:hypothetical protein TSUD_246160 [Trifolium subterraneum]|uniref:Neprosin PEP catalytic domain-containing protein n=1 Tax=Trifolium subterraneum TaxID=3900 RepID=A0A2Z6LHB8_TRISU|nr:hypothetical protein TSUD_246160 [Trifolium subterraneum]
MTSANQVMWTGQTVNPTQISSPPMGSGVQPNGILGHGCYFKNLSFVNDSRKHQTLEKGMGQILNSNREYYGAAYYDVDKIGLTIQFGGPGGPSGHGGSSVDTKISGAPSERRASVQAGRAIDPPMIHKPNDSFISLVSKKQTIKYIFNIKNSILDILVKITEVLFHRIYGKINFHGGIIDIELQKI